MELQVAGLYLNNKSGNGGKCDLEMQEEKSTADLNLRAPHLGLISTKATFGQPYYY